MDVRKKLVELLCETHECIDPLRVFLVCRNQPSATNGKQISKKWVVLLVMAVALAAILTCCSPYPYPVPRPI